MWNRRFFFTAWRFELGQVLVVAPRILYQLQYLVSHQRDFSKCLKQRILEMLESIAGVGQLPV